MSQRSPFVSLTHVLVLVVLAVSLAPPLIAQAPASSPPASACLAGPWVNSPTLQATVPSPEPFCAFHQFAWQNFLALMLNDAYLTFVPSVQVFVPTGTPAPWSGKPIPLSLGDIDKEAGDEDVLVAQNGTLVQFDIRMNRTMFDYIVDPANKLYTSAGFNRLCSNINLPVEGTDPADPIGSIELKSAWLQMPCNPASKLYVCSTDRKWALVGFHLVQKISDHQEWIWASFEHVANAPDCADLNQKPPAPFTTWALSNGKHQPCGGSGQPACSAALCTPTCNVYVDTKTPANVCRTTAIAADGTTASGGGPLVAELNASVQKTLTNPALLALRNYVLVGTLWMKPGLSSPPPVGGSNPPPGQIFIGSTALANTTMETYLQDTGQACYSCHYPGSFTYRYNPPGTQFSDAQSSEADFSHMFRILQGSNPPQPCGGSTTTSALAAPDDGGIALVPSHATAGAVEAVAADP